MKTVVRPIDIGNKIIQERDKPEVVAEGLRVLKICADTKDLVHRAIGDTTFGNILTQFIVAVETGQDPAPALANFPEWSITLANVTVNFSTPVKPANVEKAVAKKPLEVRSMANSIVGDMKGNIMLVETLFEFGAEVCTFDFSPNENYFKKLLSVNHHKTIADIIAKINEFYKYLRAIVKQHDNEIEGLDVAAKKTLKKKHWDHLLAITEEAKEIMLTLPEEMMA